MSIVKQLLPDWTEEQFLSYVHTHSRTERALFSRVMIRCLAEMAGCAASFMVPDGHEFVQLHSDVADPLVADARERMKVTPTDISNVLDFVRSNSAASFKDDDK